jgi:N-acetyl-gamma-glutamyl-phosphate reductase
MILEWDPVTLLKLGVLFVSLPTGASAEALARVSKDVKIVDIAATTATSRVARTA